MTGGFLSLTAFQAEGCGGGFAIGHTLSGVRVQRVQKVQRVLRVADCRSAAMLIKSALRDLLSVSYDMLPTRQGSGDSHQRGKTPKWYVKYMTRYFFPHISRFPLRGNPAKRERVYGAEHRDDTLSFP